jgi:hypothetical protein
MKYSELANAAAAAKTVRIRIKMFEVAMGGLSQDENKLVYDSSQLAAVS